MRTYCWFIPALWPMLIWNPFSLLFPLKTSKVNCCHQSLLKAQHITWELKKHREKRKKFKYQYWNSYKLFRKHPMTSSPRFHVIYSMLTGVNFQLVAHLVKNKCVEVGHVALVGQRPRIIIFEMLFEGLRVMRDLHQCAYVVRQHLKYHR